MSVLALFVSITVYAETLYVKGQSVSLHASPTSESENLHTLSNGEKVFVIDRANGWILVEDENYTVSGWISQQDISKTKPVTATAEKKDSEESVTADDVLTNISIASGFIGACFILAGFGSSGTKDGRTKSGYKKGKEPKASNFKLLFWGLLLLIIAYLCA